MLNLHALPGLLLLLMILSLVGADITGGKASATGNVLMLLSGISAWLAAGLLLPRVRRSQLLVISILLLTGLGLLLFSWSRDGLNDWHRVITINAGLLTMIISVGFLKLVAVRGLSHIEALPQGIKAFRGTLMTVAVFGSFINISAPVLVADRLSLNRPLTLFSCSLLTRTFSGCSAWSPFFGGMAVVLTYVEGMRLFYVMALAFPFALVGLLVIYTLALYKNREEVAEFRGYPMQLASLWIPAVLAVLVIGMSILLPHLSILTVIALGALLLTVVTLLFMDGVKATRQGLQEFVINSLPNSANELVLFLAAGVLAVGLERLVAQGLIELPFSVFSAWTASLLLGVMIIVAMLGVHPVIQIAGITPLLFPVEPNPQMLALTFMFAWSLGTCASPLSGTHLVMHGRYGIPSWQGALVNLPFVAIMFFVAVLIIHASAFVL